MVVKRTYGEENLGIMVSHCCKEDYEAILEEDGELKLICTKCKKKCGTLERPFKEINVLPVGDD